MIVIMKRTIILCLSFGLCIAMIGCIKITNCDSSLGSCDLDGNEGVKQVYATVMGKVTSIDTQMDGSILTIDTGNGDVEVLASIPNLGIEFADELKNIKVDSYVKVKGEELDGRIIAREIYRAVPLGYTIDSYTIEEVTDVSCNIDSECETPMEYLVMSRCPFASLCLENRCTVVCPDYVNAPITEEYCISEGARVSAACSEDEISIGDIEDEMCCIPSGGSASA